MKLSRNSNSKKKLAKRSNNKRTSNRQSNNSSFFNKSGDEDLHLLSNVEIKVELDLDEKEEYDDDRFDHLEKRDDEEIVTVKKK
jgi:hypothetical protein